VAADCAREILDGLDGPVVLYGHCGLGVMLTVEIARRLAEAGRPVEAIYLGGNFPTARLGSGPLLQRWRRLRERLRSDRWTANVLSAAGLEVGGMDPAQRRMIIENQRRGTREAELYFGGLFATGAATLDAPVISVVGERGPSTEFYTERYREWHALSDTTALVVLDEAGHFFLRWRAAELAAIVTGTHPRLSAGGRVERHPDATYRLAGVSRAADRPPPSRRDSPSIPKFAAVSGGQLVSLLGSALTEFALPLWVYLRTGSLARFALFTMVALLPGVLVAPLAGTVVDRASRRRVMLAGDCAAGAAQAILAVLYFTGRLQPWHIYALLTVVSLALTFQRLAYNSAVAQLVPKRYLGHANGIVQMINGIAQFFVPLAALGILSLIGIGGILSVDVASHLFAVAVTACVRFPGTLASRRRESVLAELREGVRFSAGHRGLRAMLLFFAAANVFLAPLLMLINPLVLSMAPLRTAAVVATVSGAGVAVGGLAMAVWGGPRRRRMRCVLLVTLGYAGFGAVAGAVASPWVVALGGFGMGLTLALINGIYVTIVLVKVPQRFHGRVFALNQMVAWSMISLACGLLAPAVAGALHRVSPTRGLGLTVELFAAALVVIVVLAARTRALARFDQTVPDAAVDDLVGVTALGDRLPSPAGSREVAA
jgi:MFS family permease/surfactin synthase thioesterase subunit